MIESSQIHPFGLLINAKNLGGDYQLLLAELVKLILKSKIIVLRNFSGDLLTIAQSLGDVLVDTDGKPSVLDVKEIPGGSVDGVLGSGRVPLHWDGYWSDSTPDFQIFQCVEAPRPGYGGESLFVDTTEILKSALESHYQLWEQRVFVYPFPTRDRTQEGLLNLLQGPTRRYRLIDKHPHTGEKVMRFRENDFDTFDQMDKFGLSDWNLTGRALSSCYFEILDELYSPKNCLKHAWKPGDIVITDNQALLHGRTPYFGHRRLHRLMANMRSTR